MEEKPKVERGTLHFAKSEKDGGVIIRIFKGIRKEPDFIFKDKDTLKIEYYPIERKIVIRRDEDLH